MVKIFKNKIFIASAILFTVGCIGVYNQLKPKETLKPNSTTSKSGMIAMYIEDQSGNYKPSTSKVFPTDGYVLDHAECDNGGIITQDPDTKKISGKFSHTDACNLYFKIEECPRSSQYTTITLSNGLKVYDENATTYNECNTTEMYTFDHEEAEQTTGWTESERRDYRYIGNTPNNWIRFNDEDWRIIGVFTVEKKAEGSEATEKEQLIKIIRNGSIGGIPWDDYTDGKRANDWSTSSLQGLLNGEYYNTGSSFSYTYKSSSSSTGTTITIPKGLNEKARSQIEEVKWYLGELSTWQNLGGPDYYSFERGTINYQNSRTTEINQRVGLMYPSDYIYTYDYGVDEKCYTDGYNCRSANGGTPSAGWLFNSSYQWTQSSNATSSNSPFYVRSAGGVSNDVASLTYDARPVVYLKSGIKITGGDGSDSGNAYILE